MIYQADWLLPMDDAPLLRGWMKVEGGRVVAMGSEAALPPDVEVQQFPGCVLLPGFINAHCHLELTALKNRIPAGKSFPVWVEELRGLTTGLSSEDYRQSVKEGISLLLRGGATTVIDVGNTGDALSVLSESPMRSFALVETLGLDPSLAESRSEHAASLANQLANTARFRTGVALHAAYSCSRDLLVKVNAFQKERKLPVSIHAAESAEEAELFSSASGSLQKYCRSIFPEAPEHWATSPLRWLEENLLLQEGALVIHGNHLYERDLEILLRRKSTVVHCPSSHAFFGHKAFPYAELRQRGIPVCLGTDSLASGDSLSMLDQIRMFRKNFSEVTAQKALRMATTVAARALKMPRELGVLGPRYRADFIAVRTKTSPKEDPCEAVLRPDAQVVFAAIDGCEADLK